LALHDIALLLAGSFCLNEDMRVSVTSFRSTCGQQVVAQQLAKRLRSLFYEEQSRSL
jgi:hypothetical protein